MPGFWTLDMNKCVHCPDVLQCPHQVLIAERLHNAIDEVENNEGGPLSATITVACFGGMLQPRTLWAFEMHRCASCPKLSVCPDAPALRKAIKALTADLRAIPGGPVCGTIVGTCLQPGE